jgi:metal-responsive CopG/Arc/MetJ family transcriptional regulator
MQQLSVRLSDRMFDQLDALAADRGVDRTRLVRQLLQAGLRNRPTLRQARPSQEELVALLAEKARAGNVSADPGAVGAGGALAA